MLKNTQECTKSYHFFKKFSDTPSLAPLELNFAAPIEKTWLRLCKEEEWYNDPEIKSI